MLRSDGLRQAILDSLAHGEWRTAEQIAICVGAVIAPESARKAYVRRLPPGVSTNLAGPELQIALAKGRRLVVLVCLSDLHVAGLVEREPNGNHSYFRKAGGTPMIDLDTMRRHRRTDPDTSRAAAASVKYKANSQKARILELFEMAGQIGLSDTQLRDLYKKRWGETAPSSLPSRRKELCDANLVRNSGRRQKKRTSGLQEIVWELVPKA